MTPDGSAVKCAVSVLRAKRFTVMRTAVAHPGTVTGIQTPCPDCRCGYGVTITGHDGHRYTYCHGQSLADHLQPGIQVGAGELIMASGNTGNSTTPHLHFQIQLSPSNGGGTGFYNPSIHDYFYDPGFAFDPAPGTTVKSQNGVSNQP